MDALLVKYYALEDERFKLRNKRRKMIPERRAARSLQCKIRNMDKKISYIKKLLKRKKDQQLRDKIDKLMGVIPK